MLKTSIKICLWLLAFVPLIVDNNVFYPFTASKSLYIQSLIAIGSILFLINYFYSSNFREEISSKFHSYIKNPLVLSVSSFILVLIISTCLAVDKYLAFWGELSRSEGLVGILFYFSFFIFGLLIFEKKDWLMFFKLSLTTGIILLSREFYEYFILNIDRPASYVGNPTFLAGYLLFVIASALIIINERENNFWKYFSIIIGVLSILGIFVAETRGTILGLGLGIVAILILAIWRGKNVYFIKFSVRRISIALVILGIIFSGVFAFTRDNKIWQKVPGLSRVAIIGSGEGEDISTSVRFYLYQSSLKAISPSQNGWNKLIIGWGPDNFIHANNKYYSADQYQYENKWYDRAHNKFLDVLVMNGAVGLFIYLILWLLLFVSVLKRKELSLLNIGLLVFIVSYFVHLIFIFDQVSTYIPFFAIIAYMIYLDFDNSQKNTKKQLPFSVFILILSIFLIYVLLRNTLPGYIQMNNYTSFIKNSAHIINDKHAAIFEPLTSAQEEIRRNFLQFSANIYTKNSDKKDLDLLNLALSRGEEYVKARPLDFGFMTTLADFYNKKIVYSQNDRYLKKGEEYFNKIITFVPNRPDINRGLGVNLYNQQRFTESFVNFERAFELSPSYYRKDEVVVQGVYLKFVKYFYNKRDKENFIKAANRLISNKYKNSVSLEEITKYLIQTGTWPRVNFE